MRAKLYVVPASHPCAAVERALQMKGIPYDRMDLPPVAHTVLQRARFGKRTVPGIVVDGAKTIGSRPIMRRLEALAPEPPLFPADERLRHEVEQAEEWGDQVLQPLVRRLVWQALGRDYSAQHSYLEGSKLPIPPVAARLAGGATAWAERRLNQASDGNARADLVHLHGHLRRIDGWLANGVIGGEQPNAADLQIASGLRLLLTVEDVAPAIDAHPAGDLARQVFPRYPGRVPAGTLPPEWLAPLSAGEPAAAS